MDESINEEIRSFKLLLFLFGRSMIVKYQVDRKDVRSFQSTTKHHFRIIRFSPISIIVDEKIVLIILIREGWFMGKEKKKYYCLKDLS